MEENQRNHFRLEYPKPDRPKLTIAKDTFEVLDLSERGVKFDCGPRYQPKENQVLKGTLVFHDGKSCDIAGTMLRHLADKHQCVLLLTKGVPLAKMLEEQRYLLKKYKTD